MSRATRTAAPAERQDPVDLDAYRERIGDSGPMESTLATLERLQALHPAAIPFEAMDVLTGRGVDLAPAAVDAKLIGRRRGGYCFEQNSLFARALSTVGFAVDPLLARVRWQAPGEAPPPPATHMVLRVLVDGVPYLVDVGFGSAMPTAPLRYDERAPQPTLHEPYRLVPFGSSLLLEALLDEQWTPLYEVLPEARAEADFQVANWYTSTHPSSHFRHNLTAARSTPEGRYALRDDRLTVRYQDGSLERRHLDAPGVEQALTELFGLTVEPDWRPAIERVVRAAAAAREDSEQVRDDSGG